MSTTTESGTGWSKQFPRVEGFYWARRSHTNRPEPKVIQVWQYEGDWYAYRHGDGRDIEAEDFTKSLYEWLGPITPSDFEQLVRLRDAAEKAIKWLDWIATDPNTFVMAPGFTSQEAAIALRHALSPPGEDGK